jgi:hypothetical protein
MISDWTGGVFNHYQKNLSPLAPCTGREPAGIPVCAYAGSRATVVCMPVISQRQREIFVKIINKTNLLFYSMLRSINIVVL